jgi:peroxiredoxin
MSDTQSQQQSQTTALQPGITAPDFTLRTTPNQSISLNQYRGNPVILVFYPADFSPVCGDEMTLFNELLPEFQRLNAEVIGISVDGVWCHLAFSKEKNLKIPLLADFEPKGEVAKKVWNISQKRRYCRKSSFLIR